MKLNVRSEDMELSFNIHAKSFAQLNATSEDIAHDFYTRVHLQANGRYGGDS